MTLGEWPHGYCTCYRPWLSVTPRPLCPAHGAVMSARFATDPCRGRHCAHTEECYGSMTWNGTQHG